MMCMMQTGFALASAPGAPSMSIPNSSVQGPGREPGASWRPTATIFHGPKEGKMLKLAFMNSCLFNFIDFQD